MTTSNQMQQGGDQMETFTLSFRKNVEEWQLMDLNIIIVSCQQDMNMIKYVEARFSCIKKYIFCLLQDYLEISTNHILDVFSKMIHEKHCLLQTTAKLKDTYAKAVLKREVFLDILKILKYILEFQMFKENYLSTFDFSEQETFRQKYFRIYFYLFCGSIERARFFVPYLNTPRSITGNSFSAMNCLIVSLFNVRNFDLAMTILENIEDEELQNYDDFEKFNFTL